MRVDRARLPQVQLLQPPLRAPPRCKCVHMPWAAARLMWLMIRSAQRTARVSKTTARWSAAVYAASRDARAAGARTWQFIEAARVRDGAARRLGDDGPTGVARVAMAAAYFAYCATNALRTYPQDKCRAVLLGDLQRDASCHGSSCRSGNLLSENQCKISNWGASRSHFCARRRLFRSSRKRLHLALQCTYESRSSFPRIAASESARNAPNLLHNRVGLLRTALKP